MIPCKLYMPLIFLVCGVSFFIPNAYATIIITNGNFEFTDFNLNVTSSITIDSFIQEPDGFTTNNGEDLRKYNFYNSTSPYDVHWDSIDSTKAQYTITDIINNAIGSVSGTELGSVELDDVSVLWAYAGSNIIDIESAVKVEYFFPIVVPTGTPNAIILSLNSPTDTRLGGIFSGVCDFANNYTMIGIYSNGTIRCMQWSTGPAP